MAYALVSGTSDRKVVWVQIPSSAPKTCCRLGLCALHNNAPHWNPHCVAGARQCLLVSGVKFHLTASPTASTKRPVWVFFCGVGVVVLCTSKLRLQPT